MLAVGSNENGELGLDVKEASTCTLRERAFTNATVGLRWCACGAAATVVITTDGVAHVCGGASPAWREVPVSDDVLCASAGAVDGLVLTRTACYRLPLLEAQTVPRQVRPEAGPLHGIPVKCSSGALFHAVMTTSGQILTIGQNVQGALGVGLEDETFTATSLVAVDTRSVVDRFVDVCCGGSHVLAVTTCHVVLSWGSNAAGQLGLGEPGGFVSAPTVVADLPPIVGVGAGDRHSMLVTADGRLMTCGAGECGQLGFESREGSTKFQTVEAVDILCGHVIRAAGGGGFGSAHTVVLGERGFVVFGSNRRGQLGLPFFDGASRVVPTPLSLPLSVPFVSQGGTKWSCWYASCGWNHTVFWRRSTDSLPSHSFEELPYDVCRLIVEFVGVCHDVCCLSLVSVQWADHVRWSAVWECHAAKKRPQAYQRQQALLKDCEAFDWKTFFLRDQNKYTRVVSDIKFCSAADDPKGKGSQGLFGSIVSSVAGWLPWGPQPRTVFVVGLDNSGKSLLLRRLANNGIVAIPPTQTPLSTVVAYNSSISFRFVEMPGLVFIKNWSTEAPRAVAFLVDSSDTARMAEASAYLRAVLGLKGLEALPLIVFSTKADHLKSIPVDDVVKALDMDSIRTNAWCVQGCSAIIMKGVHRGLEWLASQTQ